MISSSVGMRVSGRSLSHPNRADSSSSSGSNSGAIQHHPARNVAPPPPHSREGSSKLIIQNKQQQPEKTRQQQQHHHQHQSNPSAGITSIASPTSSPSSSSICSSSPRSSNNGSGSIIDEDYDIEEQNSDEFCDDECYSNKNDDCEEGDGCPFRCVTGISTGTAMHQGIGDNNGTEPSIRYPSNSTNTNDHHQHTHTHHSSTCRTRTRSKDRSNRRGSSKRSRRRRTHDSRNPHHNDLLKTSIISSSSSSSASNNTTDQISKSQQSEQQHQPLFSPITSNGSVISTTSSNGNRNNNGEKKEVIGASSTSNPASPLKSSIGSLLPLPTVSIIVPSSTRSSGGEYDNNGSTGVRDSAASNANDRHASLTKSEDTNAHWRGPTDETDTATVSAGVIKPCNEEARAPSNDIHLGHVSASSQQGENADIDSGAMDTDDEPLKPSMDDPATSSVDNTGSENVRKDYATKEGITAERPQMNTSNSRKSARRHSENGMKTPDESIYSYSNLPFIPSSSSSSSSSTSNNAFIDGGGRRGEGDRYTVSNVDKGDRFAVPTSTSMGLRTASTPVSSSATSSLAAASYVHPGTPAITSASTSSSTNSIPTINNEKSYIVHNPGERRIAHETTRPARRKVHRIDTGTGPSSLDEGATTAGGRSNSTPGALRSSSSSTTLPSHAKTEMTSVNYNALLDRVVSPHTTFEPRPHGAVASYFPHSNNHSNASYPSSSSSSSSQLKQDSSAAAALNGTTAAAGQGGSGNQHHHASMAFDHPSSSSASYSNNGGGTTTLTATAQHSSSSSASFNPVQHDYLSYGQQQQQHRSSQSSSSSQRNEREQKKKKKDSQRSRATANDLMNESKAKMPHMDIATFPTNNLLQLLAALLSKITAVNDAIRDGEAVPSSSTTSPSSPTSNAAGDANGHHAASSSNEQDSDSAMEGVETNGQAEDNGNTTTPPSQSYTHSRNGSNEPVTPAVPFSSPTMTRVASASSSSASNGGGKKEDVFAHDSRLTESSSSSGSTATSEDDEQNRQEQNQAQVIVVEEEDLEEESYKPRHNFYRPPSTLLQNLQIEGSSASTDLKYAHLRPLHARTTYSSTSSDRQHTILTSAAQALATPNATLCFHARNIPSISIEAYLIRISKYCPTTNEVFISLLVYFDRMSRLPNLSNLTSSLPSSSSSHSNTATTNRDTQNSTTSSNPAANSQEAQSPSSSSSIPIAHTRTRSASNPVENTNTSANNASTPQQHSHHSTFAVDSFNIHRLIIAGVTVASKFFSDVFYTNSRYAKVGGLPLSELNALELQFLLLNGFDLIVSPEELQRYADYLLTGALPPLALDSPDRFGSRSSANASNTTGRPTTTPVDTPPASRAATPSKHSSAPGSAGQALFGQAIRQNRMQADQVQESGARAGQPLGNRTPGLSIASSVQATSSDTRSHSTFPTSMIDSSSSRPKTSTRSASESSTSASEASTVVPSESSVDTERGEVDHSTADEDTGVEDDEEIDGDSRMTDVSGAPSPAAVSQQQSFAQMQHVALQQQQQQPQEPTTPIYPSNATLGADRDGFAIPARPRPPLSRTSSGGTGQRHPLLASSSGSKTPSNGGSSGGHSHSAGGKTSAAQGGVNTTGVKATAGKASTNKGNVSMHRRDNSRTREWTLQQQQQMHLRANEDAEMADEE